MAETKKKRLATIARQILAETPEVMPYFVHRPQSAQEPAPGWYWIPPGLEHPLYLGHSAFDAERAIREMADHHAAA